MDPESGGMAQDFSGESGGGGSSNNVNRNVMQAILRALVTRMQAIIGALVPKKEDRVGVENRFYYDPEEKVWKLRGGETAAERAESEAIRFHTCRGLTNSLAPSTTACDTTRGGSAGLDDLPPPPKAGGAVTYSMHAPVADSNLASLAHPVYAPQGLGLGAPTDGISGGGPPRPRPGPSGVPPAARTSPFGAPPDGPAGQQPLASPFGAAAPPAPLASPFATAARHDQAVPAGAWQPPPGQGGAVSWDGAVAAAWNPAAPAPAPWDPAVPTGPVPLDQPAVALAVDPAAVAHDTHAPAPVAAQLQTPFGAPGPLASPFQQQGPGVATALASPFQAHGHHG